MSSSYRRIQNYEKEIKKMLEQGLTHREIGEALGFSYVKKIGRINRVVPVGLFGLAPRRLVNNGTEIFVKAISN